MKFIKRIIGKIVRWSMRNDYEQPVKELSNPLYTNSSGVAIKDSHNRLFDYNNGMTFSIYNAVGGKIVRIISTDPGKDSIKSNLYIITDKEDLGEEISHIITRDALSR